jgi:hypothetical protein
MFRLFRSLSKNSYHATSARGGIDTGETIPACVFRLLEPGQVLSKQHIMRAFFGISAPIRPFFDLCPILQSDVSQITANYRHPAVGGAQYQVPSWIIQPHIPDDKRARRHNGTSVPCQISDDSGILRLRAFEVGYPIALCMFAEGVI